MMLFDQLCALLGRLFVLLAQLCVLLGKLCAFIWSVVRITRSVVWGLLGQLCTLSRSGRLCQLVSCEHFFGR